jgi:hypothetical protein
LPRSPVFLIKLYKKSYRRISPFLLQIRQKILEKFGSLC